MKKFTVIGFYEDNGQSICDHVMAQSGNHAFYISAQSRPGMTMIVALPGHLSEGDGSIVFAGEGVVDAETILEQPEVFGATDLG